MMERLQKKTKDLNRFRIQCSIELCEKKREKLSKTLSKKRRKSNWFSFLSGKRSVTKKIFSFLNDGETSEENQRPQSIQNSMLYRTVVKEKREIVKNCLEKGKKKNFVQFSIVGKR